MDNNVENRQTAQDDDEEEDDWNPEAEVGSDNGDEPETAKPQLEDAPAFKSPAVDGLTGVNGTQDDDEAPRKEEDEGEDASQARKSGSPTKDAVNGEQGEDKGEGETQDKVDGEGPDQDDQGNEGNADNDEGEDEDEDEDEEDDDEEEVRGHRQKRRRRARNQFIEEEAEVDEDDEEEDEEDDIPEGFVADEHPDDEGLDPGIVNDDRLHRDLDTRRQRDEDMSAEQIAAQMSERYADYGKSRGAPIDSAAVPQRLLLPSVEDPTIWGVKVKPGKEREIVMAIQRRVEQRMHTPAALDITSAFERGGTMAGYVYVEAMRQAAVKEAVEGIPLVFMGKSMVLVPIPEMPDLLRVKKSKTIDPGMWVRIKRGKYTGDLAYVEEVHENGLEVELKIVPREDYGLNEDSNGPSAAGLNGAAAKRKRMGGSGKNATVNRPPPRLFSENEARKRTSRYLQQIDNLSAKKFQYMGNIYVGGFLIKSYKVNHLQTEDVNPTLEEVSKFTTGQDEGADTLDLQKLSATLKQSTADSYLPGDAVEIYSGEQRGVIGKAVSVRGEIVTLRVTEGELLGQQVDAPVKDLRKRFREGDHVKVIGGSKYLDEVGLVVRIADNKVTLLTDAGNQEVTVFSKDLRAATDAGSSRLGSKYDLHDLVQLDPATVGVVVKVDRESLRILDQNGTSRQMLPSALSGKLERRRYAVATDKDGTEVRNDDTVKEIGGDQRQGRILHIHRSFLFVHSRSQLKDAGVFVLRSSQVLTVAANGARMANAGPDLTKMNPNAQRPGVNGASNGAMAPPKSMGRDKLIGKTVQIRKGPSKGLMGIVKDTTETHGRVELHTKSKVVNIKKEDLTVKDPVTGQTINASQFGAGPVQSSYSNPSMPSWSTGNAFDGGRTPAYGGGAKTPMWPSAAPTGPARTPAWGQMGGGKTPAYNGGGRTAYGGAAWGSATSYGGATAYGGATSYGGGTAYGGGKTPGWMMPDANKTPMHQPYGAPPPNDEGYE